MLFTHRRSGRFLGITGWDPSGLQVQPVTCWHPPVFIYWIGVYTINSSKWSVNFLQSWSSPSYFSNSNGSSVSNCRFSLIKITNMLRTMMVDGCNVCTFFGSTADTPTTLIPNHHHNESRATHHFVTGESGDSTTWGINKGHWLQLQPQPNYILRVYNNGEYEE